MAKALFDIRLLDGVHERRDEFAQVRRLGGREVAVGQRLGDRRHGGRGVGGAGERRQLEAGRAVGEARADAVDAEPHRRHVALLGARDHGAHDRLGVAFEQVLGQHRALVARAARPAARVAAFAFLERHGVSPLVGVWGKFSWYRGRGFAQAGYRRRAGFLVNNNESTSPDAPARPGARLRLRSGIGGSPNKKAARGGGQWVLLSLATRRRATCRHHEKRPTLEDAGRNSDYGFSPTTFFRFLPVKMCEMLSRVMMTRSVMGALVAGIHVLVRSDERRG